ncbi:hypothetical protein CJF30_00005368 [Rutstroemia sp. NJR-2017a BBW]|nr:hypothetical protein CJF30_00005368 [Rutstroemia sp. NJR-2017a BBW]
MSTNYSSTNNNQYYLITKVSSSSSSSSSSYHNNEAWKLPYNIDDSDLTFDGTPLNMLYEENKYMAEHVSHSHASRSHEVGLQFFIPGGGRM